MKNSEMNKSLHKSESFFTKVDAAETEKGKRKFYAASPRYLANEWYVGGAAAKGKATKDKKEIGGRQTTLFGLPAPAQQDMKTAGKKKKAAGESQTEDSQATVIEKESQNEEQDSQATDIVMEESQQVGTEQEASQMPVEFEADDTREDSPPIEWPESPVAQRAALVDAPTA